MYRAPAVAACLVIALAAGTASQQAAEPILYTEARTAPSTIRDRGLSYAPTYLIYADKPRTADESRQLVDALGMLPHLDEYKARAFVVGPVDNSAYGPGDLAAFQNLLRTHRSSNLKIIGIGAGATFVNNIIATHALPSPAFSPTGGTVDKGLTSSMPVPAYVHAPDLSVNPLFGLKLDGPGWAALAGRRAMVGTLSNRDGVMMKLVALDPYGHWNFKPAAEDMWAFLSRFRRDPATGALIVVRP
jgi:hypothetical protein